MYKKTIFFYFIVSLFSLELVAQSQRDALVLYRAGRYTEAIEICLEEIEKKPQNLDSYVVLTWALFETKEYHKALGWVVKGREVSRYDPRLIESHAEINFMLGRNIESLRLFQDYIAYAPNGVKFSSVYYHMGEIYLRMAQFKHADIAFSTALQLNALNSLWWARLGYAREQAKEYRYSLIAYNKSLELNKNLTEAQKGKERVLERF